MQVRVLGPLEIVGGDGDTVSLEGIQGRLLGRLALSANQVVSADRLIEDLWDGSPPPTALATLRTHVSRLRRTLGDSRRIIQEAGGYRLVLDAGECDIAVFEATLATARRMVQDGDPLAGAASFADALGLWRGSVLAGLTDAAWLRARTLRLDDDRVAAAEEWLEARLAAGDHAQLAGELEVMTNDHPLRERLWRARMLALYRSGRQAEALQVYQSLRAYLAEDLGIEPSAALSELEGAILRHDPKLDFEPNGQARPHEADAGIPLPARAGLAPQGGIVGREAERAALAGALKSISTPGVTKMLLISGEAGIGKTTLLLEAARAAHDGGAIVLYGRCDEDLAVPYRPWNEAITHLVANAPAELGAALAPHAGCLVQLAPALAGLLGTPAAPVTSDPESARYVLFGAVTSTLRAASVLAPVVLGLDDLHWADAASIQLLRHVVGALEPTRLVVVGTFRESDVAGARPLAELLGTLHREPGYERIVLGGLDGSEVLAMLEGAGHQLDEHGLALRDALLAETDGNPFFVGELLRHSVDTPTVSAEDDRWVASGSLRGYGWPVSVREVIGRRVALLGDVGRRVLAIASIFGRDFDLDLLANAAELDEDTMLDAMDRACEAALVSNVEGDRYSFVHALIEHAVYDSLSPARRARLHRTVAEVIEATCDGRTEARVTELAYHWARATAGPENLGKAISYARAAGDAALARLGPDEALRWYSQALALLEKRSSPDALLRCHLLVGMGDAQRQTGNRSYRQTLLDAARLATDIGSADLLVAAALAGNRGWSSVTGTVDTELVAVLEAACAVPETIEPADRAQLLAVLATELTYGQDFSRRRSLADEALAIARHCTPAVLAATINHANLAITAPDTVAERLALTAEALELARRADDQTLQFWSAFNRSVVLCQSGEPGEAGDLLVLSRDIADRLGQPLVLWSQTLRESARAMLAGDLPTAERLAIAASKMGSETGQPDYAVMFGAQIGLIRVMQGRAQEIAEQAAGFAARNPWLPAFLAQVYVDLDRHDEARSVLEPLVADGFASLSKYQVTWLISMTSAAYAASGIRWTEAAGMLFEALRPFADQIPHVAVTTSACQVNHYLGLLAAALRRDSEAESYFAQAAATHERIGAAWGLAMTRFAWGQFLADRGSAGDLPKASALLRQSVESARSQGYGLIERRATQALDAVGGR
jgi:DNA-binding SARP family transcriptional activator/tetratricopeptide (TPR) repeat protein